MPDVPGPRAAAASHRRGSFTAAQVAFDSVTRFEDPERLPLGTTINGVAYSADMLTQAAFEPQVGLGSAVLACLLRSTCWGAMAEGTRRERHTAACPDALSPLLLSMTAPGS